MVEVLNLPRILETLDENGRTDGMPFMPEMMKFCGRRFSVSKRVEKTCDRATKSGVRRLTDTVLLEDLRCDGQEHGGCEAGCTILWKESWLERVRPGAQSGPATASRTHGLTADHPVFKSTVAASAAGPSDAPVYSCQATELPIFTTPLEDGPSEYWNEVKWGNVGLMTALRSLAIASFNKIQRRRGGVTYPPVYGTLAKTPTATLNLQAGELVRIKSREEILATLDVKETNRGLSFDTEMVPFCGGTYRVARRVNRIIDETTGKIVEMKRDCIILEGVVCRGVYHQLCPRGIFSYWREIWLNRETDGHHVQPYDEPFLTFAVGGALRGISKRLLGHSGKSVTAPR
jgi:hypothetical protein